jgi:hypothetical protein
MHKYKSVYVDRKRKTTSEDMTNVEKEKKTEKQDKNTTMGDVITWGEE